jgi:hypothetical protein
MSFPEEPHNPEEPAPTEETSSSELIFPEETPLPEDFTPLGETTRLPEDLTPLGETTRLPPARRRRAQRRLVPPGADERAALLDGLARRAFPSFEFFLFAFFCGVVLGAAYLLDSPAMLLLGILLAPLLSPWVGLTLAILTGSWRFFFLTLIGLLVAGLLVFLTGALAGLAGHLWLPLPLAHASFHSHLWWPDLFLVALGAVLLTISFVRSDQRPALPSIMLAYGLFLPLSAGGVGLGLGSAPIWPNGLLVFLAHLALSILVGGITLAAMRFKPVRASGYLLPFLLGLISLAAVVYFTGLPKYIRNEIIATRRTAQPPTATVLIVPSSPTPTPSETPTAAFTSTETDTPQPTATSTPTPSYASILSPSGGGALVISEPGDGTPVAILINGILVELLPETQTGPDGRTWVHIRWGSLDGWVLSTVITATTEVPTLQETSALSPTPLPFPTATITPLP